MKPRLNLNTAILRWSVLATLALATPVAWAGTKAPDLDGDGIPNIVDPDVDADGIPNALDKNIDGGIAKSGPYRGKYIGDHLDNDNPAEKDIDGDGQADSSLAERDVDGDGKLDDDSLEKDIDGDGRADDALSEKDIDGDGRNDDDLTEDDIDGDSFDDDDPAEVDIDGDDLKNGALDEWDTDGDGRPDGDIDEDDDDGDGRPNRDDDDDNNDLVDDNDDARHKPVVGESHQDFTLHRLPDAPAEARGKAQVDLKASGSVRFEVELDHCAPKSQYHLLVGGVPRGVIWVGENGKGEINFETTPDDADELPLDFLIAGQTIVVNEGNVGYFSSEAPAGGVNNNGGGGNNGGNNNGGGGNNNGGGGQSFSGEVSLARTAQAPSNSEAKLKTDVSGDGKVRFQVEVKKLNPGAYSLFIGGSAKASLVIPSGKDSAKLEFHSTPTGDQLPLTFEVSAQLAEIKLGGAVFLTGTTPTIPPPGGG